MNAITLLLQATEKKLAPTKSKDYANDRQIYVCI
jgi:hypothetical protein